MLRLVNYCIFIFQAIVEPVYIMKKDEGSVTAYRNSAMASEAMNFEVLCGLTKALLATGKPNEAVQVFLAT